MPVAIFSYWFTIRDHNAAQEQILAERQGVREVIDLGV
jgi:hypothetical protein